MHSLIDRITQEPLPSRLWMLALAAYVLTLEVSLLPYATELYSARGVVPSERLPAWLGDGTSLAVVLQTSRIGLAALLFVPRLFSTAAVGLWLTRVVQLQINPFSLAPQEPVLLVLLALAPAYANGGKISRKRDVVFAARLTLALSLFAAGWSKVSGTSDAAWLDGSALYWILKTSPLATPFGAWMSENFPRAVLGGATYLLLAAELAAPLLLFGRSARRAWTGLAIATFATGPLFLDLSSVFAGLLLAIAFTFEPRTSRGKHRPAQSASPSGISEGSSPTMS